MTRSYVVRIGPRAVHGDDPLLSVVRSSDVDAVRTLVQSEVTALQNAVIECLTSLDPATVQAWNTQAAITLTWLGNRPQPFKGGTLEQYYDQGKALEGVLRDNWYPRLRAAGCTVPDPPAPLPALRSIVPSGLTSFLEELPPLGAALLLFLAAKAFK